jgi:hypothetical protein
MTIDDIELDAYRALEQAAIVVDEQPTLDALADLESALYRLRQVRLFAAPDTSPCLPPIDEDAARKAGV